MATVSFDKVVVGQVGQPVDLEIADGCFAVLTGSRGSGKSNMLRALAGLARVSAGEIRIGGKCVNALAPKNRDVAMVSSGDSLYPQKTARENITFGLERRRFGTTEIGKRVEEASAILSIGHFFDEKPSDLSLGQRQRVAIARAVVRQPKVLLFDHAFDCFDGDVRTELRKEIAALHERLRMTTIFATADIREAMNLGEMIAILDGGALQAFDTSRALYEKPINLFVAQLLGSPPMNFFHGELKENRGALRFHESGTGTIELDLSKYEQLKGAIPEPVILGIRPEDIELAEIARATGPSLRTGFRALAELVLPAGGATDIYFHTGAHAGTCRSAGWVDREQVGRRAEFVVNLEKAHFFAQNSGKRIF